MPKLLAPLLPEYLRDTRPDPTSPHRRRFTRQYKRKQALVRKLWIGAGLVILLNPTLAMLLIVSLATTCLAFTVLDETP